MSDTPVTPDEAWGFTPPPPAAAPEAPAAPEAAVAVAEEPAPAPEPEPEPEPEEPAAPPDLRPRWACVDPLGPRTKRLNPVTNTLQVCPIFPSDAHLQVPREMVRCPSCGGTSVRAAFPGEE
jgi:hypothetical protein